MKLFSKTSPLVRTWYYLAGSRSEFSMENRAFNAISIITFILLVLLFVLNFFVDLNGVGTTVLTLIVFQAVLYYFSRYQKRFHISIVLYALISYVALVIIYRQNGGINGPMIFCFFITFHLLIALTPNRIHFVWLILHLLIPSALMVAEYVHPNFVPSSYPSRFSRFFDIDTTFMVAIIISYCITLYLRNSYAEEKRNSEKRAGTIIEQTKKLEEISWMQSHMVRNHATTILGLAQLFNEEDAADPMNKEILEKLKEAAGYLDTSIKEVDAKTKALSDKRQ